MRKLILALMLSVLLLGFGSAMAATSAIDNLPGGAGVIYFQAGSGWQTLVNIQSMDAANAWTIHVTIHDRDSNDLIDFQLPFTPRDNVGITLTSDGAGSCTVYPYSDDAFGGSILPDLGQAFPCPAYSGMAYGYITLVADKVSVPPADPKLAPSWTLLNFVNPDMFVMRAALLHNTDAALAANATMIQGFANMMTVNGGAIGLTETNVAGFEQFVNTNGADALCTAVAVDWNNAAGIAFNTNDDPSEGPDIDSWELYSTDNRYLLALRPLLIVDGIAAGAASCNRNGRQKALGSSNNLYWGRYNQTPAPVGTSSALVMVFPASPGTAAGTADPRGAGSVVVKAFDDAEASLSRDINPTEVTKAQAGTDFNVPIHSGIGAGELLVSTATPMYGWVMTETSGFVDVYPLVRERIAVVMTNLVDANGGGLVPDPGVATNSNIILIP